MDNSFEMFLTIDELRALTRRVQHAAQVRVLRAMGIQHGMRPDGSVAVLRSHVERLFGGTAEEHVRRPVEPNWGALNASRT